MLWRNHAPNLKQQLPPDTDGLVKHKAKRITGERKAGGKSWQTSQPNAFRREPCGWNSQPHAWLSHIDFMPAKLNLVTMWLDWRDSPPWQNFKVT